MAVNISLRSELIPNFDSGIFYLKPYSILRQTTEVVYSEPLQSNGLTWRLKVYPNGNGVAKGTYISIFLEMIKVYQRSYCFSYLIYIGSSRFIKV